VLAAGLGEIPNDVLWRLGPILAFVFFLLALIVRVSGIGDEAERRWYDARAAAESIKSASWQYSVGGEAYRLTESDSDQRFTEFLQKVLKTLPHLDIAASADGNFSATTNMKALRDSAQTDRAATYVKERVNDQIGWYSRKAKWNKKRATWWTWILIAVEGAAVLLGLLRLLKIYDVNLLGIFAAAGAGIAAWQQTKNHSSLSEAYVVTSYEAKRVGETIDAQADEETWAQMVHDAEAAFSREHTLWLARRQGPKN
jgi:hypothetical protein